MCSFTQKILLEDSILMRSKSFDTNQWRLKMTNDKAITGKKTVLSVKKENVQQLKVRTNLKGGAVAKLGSGACGTTCHCLAAI